MQLNQAEQATVDAAIAILDRVFSADSGTLIESPLVAADYFKLKLAGAERELFCALFLTTQHRTIAFDILFEGTLASCTVHAREIVKRALALNAGAVILGHNHPSGDTTPSQADVVMTERLTTTLGLVDVRVLDHLVVGGNNVASLAQLGLM